MPVATRVRVENVDNVIILRLLDRMVFDEKDVREVGEQIQAALPVGPEPVRVIVDFTGVELISSSLLGKLILLMRRIENAGGKLRLCELSPTIHSVFRTSNLDRLFGIDRDRNESLDHV